MRQFLSHSVVIILVLILIINIFTITVFARDARNYEDYRDSAVKLAKVAAAIYLMSRLNTLINPAENSDDNSRKIDISGQDIKTSDKIIVIDPGHGGSDPGAIGSGGLKEKDVNLDIALRLYDLLTRNTDFKVYLTRKNDSFITLSGRTALASRVDADVFISIHVNADETGLEKGIETYAYYNTSRESWSLAWYIQESLVNSLQLADRGLKADNFQVIRDTTYIKSVLLEIAFISNKREENLLKNSQYRARVAQAVYDGILRYYAS